MTRSSFAESISDDVGGDWVGKLGASRSLPLYGLVYFTYQICIEFLHTVVSKTEPVPALLAPMYIIYEEERNHQQGNNNKLTKCYAQCKQGAEAEKSKEGSP